VVKEHSQTRLYCKKKFKVCIKHFPENFIIREDKAVKTDGTVLVVPRQRLKLPDDAYATIFLDQPSYITKILPAKRKNPETCLDKLETNCINITANCHSS
jgi:hypothetical protein